jgi:protein TonB
VGVSAIEVHDPLGAASRDGSIFRRLFILSLVIHAIIVFATMWTSPFGEERSAGGTDEIIPLDGISVEIVDSLPGDGAAIPAPVSLGTLLDADDIAPAPVKFATAANSRDVAEPETTLVTEERLSAAAVALTPPAQPVAAEAATAVAETLGTPLPDGDAQLEIDTPSFAVAASSVASAHNLSIESVIAASEAMTAAKVESPAAATIVAPGETAATATPMSASTPPPDNAEAVASSPNTALATAEFNDSTRNDVVTVREPTSADSAAALGDSSSTPSVANDVAAEPTTTSSVAAAESPAIPEAPGPSDAAPVASLDLVETAPSRSTALEETPPSSETAAAPDRQALDAPRAVPAETTSAPAAQTTVAAAAGAADVTHHPAAEATTSAIAAPPVVDTTPAAPLGARVNQPMAQASAVTTAVPEAVAIDPVAGDSKFDAVAVEPGADIGAVAAVAPVETAEDTPPAALPAAEESSAPQVTAAAPAETTSTAPEALAQTTAPTTPETDQSLQSDPLNLVAAPLPRPRPNIDVAGLDQNATAEAAATPKPKAATKPVRKPTTPATNSVPLLGGVLSPFSVAQAGGRGPTAGVAGAGGTNRDAQGRASASSYQATLFAHLRRFRSYPPEARRAGIKGTATVTFTVNASGALVSVTLSGGSGAAILDREALAMVRRASPFPPIPPGLRQSQMTVRAPIRFDIR